MVKKYEHIEGLIQDLNKDSISSVLKKYQEAHTLINELNLFIKELEDVCKVFLKTRKWTSYKDKNTKMFISIDNIETQKIDHKLLKMLLNEEQLSKVTKKVKEEKVTVITKDRLARLKQYAKGK